MMLGIIVHVLAALVLTILTVAGSERSADLDGASPLLHQNHKKSIRLDPIATIPTHGAAGWEYFSVPNLNDDSHTHYLAVSNFMTNSPASADGSTINSGIVMEAESVVYEIIIQRGTSGETKKTEQIQLHYKEVQRFATIGAHGVHHLSIPSLEGQRDTLFLAIPNFYGTDTVIYQYQDTVGHDTQRNVFREHQRIATQGAAAVEFFTIQKSPCNTKNDYASCPVRNMLAIAEFNNDKVSIYEYVSNEWVLNQKLYAPGTAALSVMTILQEKDYVDDNDIDEEEEDDVPPSDKTVLMTASYNVKGEWNTQSQIFVYDHEESVFVFAQLLLTVGAHGIATLSTPEGRHFAFYANDKNNTSALQRSALYEYLPIPKQPQHQNNFGMPQQDFEFVLRQEIDTEGAHGATFVTVDGMYYLVVAEFGDRAAQRYSRSSTVYRLDLDSGSLLVPHAELSTEGATDFESFRIDGSTFVVVSNEQNESKGVNIGSTIWRIAGYSKDIDGGVRGSSMSSGASRPYPKDEL